MQRVLIIENQLLLGAGLQELLSDQTDFDVIGISPNSQDDLVREIRQIQPNVAFLNEDSHLTDANNLLAFLEDLPELRVIVVSANHDVAYIYNKQEIRLYHHTDLFGIIREDKL